MGIAKRQGILETATVVFGHRFRALVKHDGCGETTVSITVDKQKHGDEIVWLHSYYRTRKPRLDLITTSSITMKSLTAHFSYERCST